MATHTNDTTATLNAASLANTVQKLRIKLARQTGAVKETEQHIAAIEALIVNQLKK